MLRFVPTHLRFVILFSLVLATIPACHRGYYRRMADAEAKKLVNEKSSDPRWDAPNGEIEIDPQSRMFDPFSKDHPPMPPDDPAANQFMNCVDGRPGYPHWHANGDTAYVENPEWKNYLPMDEQGRVVIDTNTAISLSLIHSPDYQTQREELFLSALDVSLERFGFDSQLFAGFNSFFETQGRFRGGGTSRSNLSGSLGATGNGINYQKLGITGANFVVGLANSVLWNFSGPNTQSASSLINFSITQPLLRNAGRERIMESLTAAERTLLGNVRLMERYRQGFYLAIVTGRSAGPGPNRGGSFLSNPTAASSNAGGILGLLQAQQQIRFAEYNVQQFEDTVEQLREFFNAQQIDSLQVQQAEINLYQAQQSLLNTKVNYQNTLDRFKQSLGIPPDVEVVIRDSFLDRFILISDDLQDRQRLMNELRRRYGTQSSPIDTKIREFDDALELWTKQQLDIADGGEPPAAGEKLDKPVLPRTLVNDTEMLSSFIDEGLAAIDKTITEDKAQILADIKTLEDSLPERLAYLKKLRTQFDSGAFPVDIDPGILNEESIANPDDLRARLEVSIKAFEQIKDNLLKTNGLVEELSNAAKELDDGKLAQTIREDIITSVATELTRYSNQLTELSLLQVLARSNSIGLKEVNIDSATATEIARCFRLDWMNARSDLVDSWRQIEFVADQLESRFDLVLEGGIGNQGDNPFKIRYENGNLRGGFRFDAPVVRMAERNQYRQALIRYQQTRRSFYQFEDEIKRNLRLTVRTIDLNKIQFELARRNLQASIQNLEQSRLRLEQPPAFSQGGVRTTSLGATTSRDLTSAINQLNQSQTSFLSFWLQYEVLRRGLDYDLGTFQVDESGHWIDPELIDREIGFRTAAMMGIDPTCLECNMPPDPMTTSIKKEDSVDDNLPDENNWIQDAPSEPGNVSPNLEPANGTESAVPQPNESRFLPNSNSLRPSQVSTSRSTGVEVQNLPSQ